MLPYLKAFGKRNFKLFEPFLCITSIACMIHNQILQKGDFFFACSLLSPFVVFLFPRKTVPKICLFLPRMVYPVGLCYSTILGNHHGYLTLHIFVTNFIKKRQNTQRPVNSHVYRSLLNDSFNSPSRARTYNNSVNSRVLYH